MTEPSDPRFYRNLLDSLLEGVYFVDRERRISYWNRGAQELIGFSASEVLGKRCHDELLVHTDENGHRLCDSTDCPAARAMKEGKDQELVVYVRHRDGHRIPMLTRVRPLRDESGAVVGAVELFSDATGIIELRERLKALENATLVDSLTGVGNRRYGEMALQDHLSGADRYDLGFATIFADIDDFKLINDRHGHGAGDAVLRTVAATLQRSTRSSDAVARWGGEEFLVILTGCPAEKVKGQAEKLRRLVAETSTLVEGLRIEVTMSMGAVVVPPIVSAEELVKRADALMYEAKRSGRNRVCVGGVAD